jgi:conjugative relaxase-like TrwC/TraI family protein
MLSIGKLGGAGGSPPSAGYYTASVAKGREDYYAGRGEAPGEWIGQGAGDLGLCGEVDADGLGALMAGIDPASGDQLREAVGHHAVTGFDLTFSTPKSVSILYAAADEETSVAVRRAHDESTVAALSYMEREACRSRRGKGGAERVVGEGFVGGAFRHRTSRAGDPQLHTHVVVGNVTKCSDGNWRTLDGRALYQHAKTGGYVYQAELRARLTEYIGVDWNEPRNGMADVAGMPRSVIEHFSQRRAEIVDALSERKSDSARSAQAAALATRRAKDYSVERGRVHEEWRARAAEHGLGPAELEGLVGRVAERPQPGRGQLAELAAEIAGPDGLTKQASSFDRRAVVQAFAGAHRYGSGTARLEQLADGFLESPHVLALEGDLSPTTGAAIRRRDGRLIAAGELPRYSTPELIATERRLVEGAKARQGEGAGVASADAVDKALAARRYLSDEQAAMVRSLTCSGDGVEVVRAAAGTGKTTALEAAQEAWSASGYRVVGATLAARAAAQMRAVGGISQAGTIARLLMDLHRGWGFTEKNVVVVDEAGMVGTRDLERIASEAGRARAKLVLVGDDRQLPEIDAGGAFRGLAERLGARELVEVRRQREEAERAALSAFRAGRPAEWVRSMEKRDRLVVARGAQEQQARLVSDWWQARSELDEGKEALMFTPGREAAQELNLRARVYMREAGELGDEELRVGERGFSVGDRVLCLRNAERELGVLNGERGTVTAIDEATRSLSVAMDKGSEATLPASYVEQGHLSLGYAMTVHKSQGMTAERAYVLGSEELYREQGYTAFSRHRELCRFYINAGEPQTWQLELDPTGQERDEVLERLARTLGRSRAKELALDVHEADAALRDTPDAELAERAGEVDELLRDFPAEARATEREARELDRQAERIRADEERLAASCAEREQVGRLRRAERAELDARIARQEETLAQARRAYGERAESLARAEAAGDGWLERNGARLTELTVIERELAERRERAYRETILRAAHDPSPEVEREFGPRPESLPEQARWDRAAFALERYRLCFEELPGREPPANLAQRASWMQARGTVDELFDREPLDHTPDLGPATELDVGPDLGP